MALSGSDPKLIVALEARLDRFEKQLREAGLIAEREMKDLESKMTFGTTMGNLISKAIEKAFTAAVDTINKAIEDLRKFNDVAEITALSFERIQRIAIAGLAGGLDLGKTAAGLDALALKLDDMNRAEGELGKFLTANNLQYKERNGLVIDANKALELAATLMGRAGSEAEKIRIAEKFGLTRDWVKVLGEGVEKFREMQAAANVNPDLQRAAQHLEAIAKLSNLISADSKQWGLSLATGVLPTLDLIAGEVLAISGMWAKMTENTVFEKFVGDIADRIGALATRIQQARAEAEGPLKVTVNKPSGVVFPKEADTGERDALTKAQDLLKKNLELMQAELETVGLTVGKQEEARQLALLMEAARRSELTITTEQTQEMIKQAEAAGVLKQRLTETTAAWSEMMSASREVGSILSEATKAMVLQGQKFDQVLKNILNRVASKAFDKLFDLIFAAPAGGGSSIFGSILSGAFKGGMAGGGPVSAGGAYMVGERGPELFVPGKSGMVVPNTALARGAGGDTVITGAPTAVTIQGSADRSTIELMRQMFEARDRRFIADVARASLELRRRSAFA